MKLQELDFRVWNEQEKKFVSNAVLMMSYVPILDCLGESNTEVICGEYDFVENKNNENILTRFSRFFKQFLQKFQKTRITAPSDFSKNLTCEFIPKDYIAESNVIDIEFYTGFKDSKGKKIYEGDIVRFGKDEEIYRFVISFKNGCFNAIDEKECNIMPITLFGHSEYYTILGNIHENPELLESLEN
ncbi:YopX family protein [Helicobacter ganmani]|uniref:YopX family protein n=1 Tax=Helicobacter ganmani TaxID=60246 RepID=UPI003A841613